MSEQSNKWDAQWSALLTHCYGKVEADADFKAGLLTKLKAKTVEHHSPDADAAGTDDNWRLLLASAYRPCEPSPEFRDTLLLQLKARQVQLTRKSRTQAEDEALQTILTKSYHPVTPRREFQTRLLENLKERQRSHTTIRFKTRRRTFVLSGLTSVAAAAMVLFVVWLSPVAGYFGKPAPERAALALTIPEPVAQQDVSPSGIMSEVAYADVVPASYEPSVPTYNALAAFTAAALPVAALGRKNIEFNSGSGWQSMDSGYPVRVTPGMAFRAVSGQTGFIGFNDDTMLSMNPGTVVEATADGLAIVRGFAKVSVPESSDGAFRLHFPDHDLAIEAGTELAVLVESPEDYAEGGVPAPVVMVLQESGSAGGLALAKGRNGVAPLFARHLYKLDKYVTPDLPGRALCAIECEDIQKMYKSEPVQNAYNPVSALAGSVARKQVQRSESRVYTPVGYTRKADRWVANGYSDQKTVKIRYLSDVYFGLARERRDLAPGLALGGNVIVDGGDGVFYEIHK